MTCVFYGPYAIQALVIFQGSRLVHSKRTEVRAVDFKKYVMFSMKTLFGEVGVSRNIDLLTYNESERRGILRCPSDLYVKVRAALTLFESEDKCSFQVTNSSPLLLSLVSNSRTYIHS